MSSLLFEDPKASEIQLIISRESSSVHCSFCSLDMSIVACSPSIFARNTFSWKWFVSAEVENIARRCALLIIDIPTGEVDKVQFWVEVG